jgi:hypothetical protein
MYGLAFLQHLNESGKTLRTGLRFLGRVQPPENRVPVRGADGCKERLRFRMPVELRLEIHRDCRRRRRIVGGIPSAILLRALDLGESTRPHLPALYERECLFAIDLRPDALRPAGHETLQPAGVALWSFQRVDPTVTKRDLDGFGIGDGFNARRLLCESHPDPTGSVLVFREPRFPRRRILEGSDRNKRIYSGNLLCGFCLHGFVLRVSNASQRGDPSAGTPGIRGSPRRLPDSWSRSRLRLHSANPAAYS